MGPADGCTAWPCHTADAAWGRRMAVLHGHVTPLMPHGAGGWLCRMAMSHCCCRMGPADRYAAWPCCSSIKLLIGCSDVQSVRVPKFMALQGEPGTSTWCDEYAPSSCG